jgi:hypothetical protein
MFLFSNRTRGAGQSCDAAFGIHCLEFRECRKIRTPDLGHLQIASRMLSFQGRNRHAPQMSLVLGGRYMVPFLKDSRRPGNEPGIR